MPRTGRTRRRQLAETVLAVTAGLSTWLVMTPAAEASWSPTIGLSPAGWLGQDWPSVTVDRHGDTLLAWAACQTGQTECVYRVQVRTRSRAGRLGPVKTISPLRSAEAAWPEAATDDDGNSAIVWENNSSQVMGRRISASGTVGPLHLLSTSAPAGTPKVVMTPTGTALAVWPEDRNGSWYEVARYLFKNGSLGRAITLGPVVPDWPGVAVDRFGTAIVAWTEPNGSVVARRIKPGHVSAVKQIMAPVSGIGYGMVVVSVNRGGDAVICFLRSNNTGSAEPPHVWARRWTQKGRLSAVLRISPPTGNVHFYHVVATDFAGDSMVLWSQWTSTTQTAVFGRRISRTGSLGPIIRLGTGDRPAIAVDDDGAGLAVWQGLSDSMSVSKVYARRFSSSGSFGPLRTLSSDGRVVRVASSPLGRFSVIWQQSSYPYTIRGRFGP